jgi:magnesium transporter
MLSFHSATLKKSIAVDLDADSIPPEVNWIDAFRPELHEIAFLERVLGIEIPSLADLSEIENSSRLYLEKNHLFLSTPVHFHTISGMPRTTPLGLVLSKQLLLTVRFKPIKALDQFREGAAKQVLLAPGGAGALIAILEIIIDRVADELELIGTDLDRLSEKIFEGNGPPKEIVRPREKSGEHLRFLLRKVGRAGDHAGKISDVLLGLARLIPFVTTNTADYLSGEPKAQLKSLQRDISSLKDYQLHLSNKIQFLLDATLGLTNIDQNDVFRVLTAVSVIGIPPTFITSLYGMNFKFMPELEWQYGYLFAWTIIALSALIPMLWFKRQGWW